MTERKEGFSEFRDEMGTLFTHFILAGCELLPMSKAQMERYAHSRSKTLRMGVAMRDNIPANVLHQLAQDENLQVVRQVAFNENITAETITYLVDKYKDAEGPHVLQEIRYAIISNPETPLAALWNLLGDTKGGPIKNTKRYALLEKDEETVREFAKTMGISEEIIEDSEKDELIEHLIKDSA